MAQTTTRFELMGADALANALQAMSVKMERKVLRQAVARAAKPIVAAASARAPVNSGLLAKSEIDKEKSYRQMAVAVIGAANRRAMAVRRRILKRWRKKHAGVQMINAPSRIANANPAQYAHLVEFGTKPHPVGKGLKSKAQRVLSRIMGGRRLTGMHPGTAPQPFLRPAFDANANKSLGIMQDEVRKAIEEHGLEAYQYVKAAT